MHSCAYSPRDPYADSSVQNPCPRRRHPLHPREIYTVAFTRAPLTIPFPPTGSYYYRQGVFNGRAMTAKEQRFEHFVNAMQARADELSDLREWRRLKDYEEEAILFFHQNGENLAKFAREMNSRDQNQTEYQVQRRRQKFEDLNPQKSLCALRQMELNRLATIRAREAEERARTQERVRSNAVAGFRAQVQASGDQMSNPKCITDTAASQQASQQSKRTWSKPEQHGKIGRPISSAGAGLPRQQEQKTKLSAEEIRRQFQDQVRSLSERHPTTKQSISSTDVGSSRQHDQTQQLGGAAPRRKPQDQTQSSSATKNPAVRSTPSRLAPATRGIPANRVDTGIPAAGEGPFIAELAHYHPRMGIDPATHYPKGAVLLKTPGGLPKLHLGPPSVAARRLTRDAVQRSDARHHHPATAPGGRHSASPSSSQQSSSRATTPPSSLHSSPPKTPEASPVVAPANTIPPARDPSEIDNGTLLQELEAKCYHDAKLATRFQRLRLATRTDPVFNGALRAHLEYADAKSRDGQRVGALLQE